MKTILLFACALAALGQSPVNQSAGPPPEPVQKLFFYDGSSNLVNVCMSSQRGNASRQRTSDGSLTNIAVATNVGTVTTSAPHGLYIGARVTVSGAAIAALNTAYTIVTAPSATTYTIATASVGDGTYTDAALTVTTNNPLTTQARWAIQVMTYTGAVLNSNYWAAGSTGYSLACSNRAAY